MRKMIVVAVREYQAAVKTKAFIISLVALPLIWGGSIGVQLMLKDKVDTRDKRIAILDYTGELSEAIADAAAKRNASEIFRGEGENQKQVEPRYLIEKVQPTTENIADATFALSQRVRADEIMAFVVIAPRAVAQGASQTGHVEQSAVTYHSNSPTYDDIVKWLRDPINDRIRRLRLAKANLDPGVVEEATRRVSIENLGLVSKDETGAITRAEKTNELANIFLPMGLMMLMLMVIMVGAQPLMQSVLEEKTQRIAEVLLGSVPPFQLMMGKLVGMVGVSLTIATVYLIAGFLGIRQAGFGHFFPAHVVWWFVIFQALAVLMYGSMFIAVGAAVSDLKEAQSLLTPIMVITMAPIFVWLNVVKEPNSTLALGMSLFPPATPMLMIIRQAVPPGIPFWQPVVGVVLMLLTTVLFVFAAGRIFRVGILMQGKGAKFGEMIRWAISG